MMKLSQESLVKKFEYVKYVKALQAGELQSKYGPGMPVMCSMPLQKVAPKLHCTQYLIITNGDQAPPVGFLKYYPI